MNLNGFSNVASTIESIAVVLALGAGAIWAVIRFRLLRAHKKYPALDMQISASQPELPNDDSYFISAEVQIRNHGSRPALLPYDLAESPFTATPLVAIDETGRARFGTPIRATVVADPVKPSVRSVGSLLRPGEVIRIPFIVTVSEPGLYWLNFETELRDKEARTEVGHEGTPEVWVAKNFFVVQPLQVSDGSAV